MGSAIASLSALAKAAVLIDQMRSNYRHWSDALDDLDRVVKEIRQVKNSTHEAFMRVDYPWLLKKQTVLYLIVPAPNMCGDATRYASQASGDGQAVDTTSSHLAGYSPGGVPSTWQIQGGQRQAHLAQAYEGPVLANSAKRRQERFQEEKTQLVLRAQQAARMNLSAATRGLQTAMGIHDHLAAMAAAQFQAAGVGLGTVVGNIFAKERKVE